MDFSRRSVGNKDPSDGASYEEVVSAAFGPLSGRGVELGLFLLVYLDLTVY